MLIFFLFYLHELCESGHCQNLVNLGRYVCNLKLALKLCHGTHGLLDDTQTRAGHICKLCAVHLQVDTAVAKSGLDVLLELVGIHSVDS